VSRGPSRPTPPPAICGKAAIFAAIPPGSRRCRSQREWLRAALAEVEAQGWYANRAAHYAGICRVLMRRMNWAERTSRPGHLGIAAAVGVSPDTVARAVAWLRGRGLLGLVSAGTTADVRPHVLYAGTANLAAVYVLTMPRRRSQACSPAAGRGRICGPNQAHEVGLVSGPSREALKVNPGKARAPRGQPLLPPGGPALHHCPSNRSEGLTVAAAVRERSRHLGPLSPEHIRWLARAFFRYGWTGHDVLAAIDRPPQGRPWGFTHPPHSPAKWAAWRLAAWLGPDGLPLPSLGQLAAETHRQNLAEAARRRAERREPGATVAAEGAALARRLMAGRSASASPAAPPPAGRTTPAVVAQPPTAPGRSARPSRPARRDQPGRSP
jgi:hypothetical protein